MNQRIRKKRAMAALAVLVALSLAAAACGSDDDDAADVDNSSQSDDTGSGNADADADTDADADADTDTDADDHGADFNVDAATLGAYAGIDKDLSGVELRMAMIGGQPYEAMYESLNVFEEATGASVELVFLGDGFEIDRYLKTTYASGTVDFDVAWNHTSFMAQFTNFTEPLQDWLTDEELAVFSPAIMEAATINGDIQLLPRHADISSMHYRLDLFNDAAHQAAFETEYGYPLAAPTTIDEMYDMAEYFVGSDAVPIGTQFAGKEEGLAGRFYELLIANGGNYFDDDLNPIFDSAAGVQTAQWMRDLYENDLIPADTPNLLWPEVAQNFCDGNVAFYVEWPGWYSYFQDPESCPAIAGNFGQTVGVTGSEGSVRTGWAGAHAFSVAQASENKEAAVQLLKFLTSERVAYEESQLGLLSVRSDVWERAIADGASSDVAADSERLVLFQELLADDFRGVPQFADWISFTDTFVPTLQAIILGDKSVKDGLADAVDDTADLLDSLGY